MRKWEEEKKCECGQSRPFRKKRCEECQVKFTHKSMIDRTGKYRRDKREKVNETQMKYAKRNPEKVKQLKKEWLAKNPDHARRQNVKNVKHLSNAYVVSQLRSRGFRDEHITDDLIEIKRKQIELKRLIKGVNDEKRKRIGGCIVESN